MDSAHRDRRRYSLGLALSTLAALLGGCLGQRASFCSTQNAPSLLNVDAFQEILSNHTDISRTLTQAPFVTGADESSPAYEFTGQGFHISEKGLSDGIRAASCATNELTMYASVYFRDSQSAGPLLELSYANMAASRLPIFGMSMDAHFDEISVFFRHRGQPHAETFLTRLHGGRWRRYAVSLSGNLLKLYVDCNEIYSRIVPLPDYCANDSSNVMLTVADSAVREHTGFTTGLYVYLQKIGFQFGRGGIRRQCPTADDTCPSCGQFLTLVEKVYELEEEVMELQQRVADLDGGITPSTEPPTEPQMQGRSCLVDDITVGDGQFRTAESGEICFCRDGNPICTPAAPLICEPDTTSEPTPDASDRPPTREPDTTPTTPDLNPDNSCQIPELNNVIIPLGAMRFRYEDSLEMCRKFTCVSRNGRRPSPETVLLECSGNISTCSPDLSPDLQEVALCCENLVCTACSFTVCPENAECVLDGSEANCECDSGYEKNGNDECVDRNECILGLQQGGHDCPSNSQCRNTPGNFTCNCNNGYHMVVDRNGVMICDDVNECVEEMDKCPDNSNCMNTVGSHDCNCLPGYVKTADDRCQPTCDPPCQNGGECTAPNTCTCLKGYTGSQCEADVNECQEQTHGCTHPVAECINTIGGFFCRCQNGYQGNGTHCEDVDECDLDINNCVQGSRCFNGPGTFACICDNELDCTGACLRNRELILNGRWMLEGNNMCRNCSCSNGELTCRRVDCDCRNVGIDPHISIACCPQCFNIDCRINDTFIRRGRWWTNPNNRCERCRCNGQTLTLDCVDRSKNCTQIDCPNEYQYTPPGKCCPVCILPNCNAENKGMTVSMRNGCRTCTCSNSIWTCSDKIVCPTAESCVEEQVLFYQDGCCPICERQALGSQTCTRTTTGS